MSDREQIARVVRFAADHPRAVLYDEIGGRLLDVFSGKSVPVGWARIVDVVERATRDTGEPYLILLRDDGVQIVLAPAGVAFALNTRNSGPLPGAPPVVCLRDYHRLRERLDHVLRDHPEEKPGAVLLDMVRFAIAILDGARAVGLDVGTEEKALERCVVELEQRR
jgi:uncharacterized protein YbjT (DUF2867 family)